LGDIIGFKSEMSTGKNDEWRGKRGWPQENAKNARKNQRKLLSMWPLQSRNAAHFRGDFAIPMESGDFTGKTGARSPVRSALLAALVIQRRILLFTGQADWVNKMLTRGRPIPL
jgi:hypothetical protein